MTNWGWDVITAIVSGIATTLSAAIFLSLWNWIRNYWLKYKIVKNIQHKSDPRGVIVYPRQMKNSGILIYNPFDFAFTVRSVWAEYGDDKHSGRCPLRYDGIEYQEDTVPVATTKRPYDYIVVEPFTNGKWIVEKESVGDDRHFNRLSVHVEFTTFFRSPKVIKVSVGTPQILQFINQMVDENKGVKEAGKV